LNQEHPLEPIAIIGMGCRFPRAQTPAAFWRLLCESGDAISKVPADRWDADAFYDADPAAPGKMNSRHGGFLEGIDQFDAEFFGIPPREADFIDPQHRLLLEVAWEAIQDAGIVPASLAGSATGVFIGLSSHNYATMLHRNAANIGAFSNIGGSACIAANRISYFLDLAGPSIVADTACSSSLVAIHLACQSIWTGESTLALAGGVNIILVPGPSISLAKGRMLSPDGRCRVFDARADGFGRGEGAGVVLLKPLHQAIADCDPIYSVIRATAMQQNGRTNGLTAPNRWAQEKLLRTAYSRANISPGTIQYIEAHSSGTLIGDASELNALASVLSENRLADQKCALGSVKTNFGHLEAAAGIAGLIKVALMLRHRQLVPSLHFESPNPHVDFSSMPLHIQRELQPWPSTAGDPIAGISASGYGGANAHVVMQAPPTLRQPTSKYGPHTLPLSAHNPAALHELAHRYIAFLQDDLSNESLAEICFTLSARRTHFPHRLAVTGDSAATLLSNLQAFIDKKPSAGLLQGTVKNRRHDFSTSQQLPSDDLAANYITGQNVDWKAIYPPGMVAQPGLPTYPFQRRRHWIPNITNPPAPISPPQPRSIVEPSNDIQRTLVKLWQKILGVEDIAVTDNFFDLGGGSLMAVELCAEIERVLGIRQSPSVLFEQPTIEQLSRVIKSRRAEDGAAMSITIRSNGSKPPIFLIAPDHLLWYRELISQLDEQHPIYGLQAPYADGFRKSGITIEQMADIYITQLTELSPQGPCHLVGLCAGGVIAYEMARRLTANGQQAGLVALIDAPCPAALGQRRFSKLGYLTLRCRTHLREMSQLSFRDALHYLAIRIGPAFANFLTPFWKSTRAPADPAALASMANREAIYRYRPIRTSARIDLFHADHPWPSPAEDTRMLWRDLADDVQVHRFNEIHDRILNSPTVDAVAKKINQRLASTEENLNQEHAVPIAANAICS
jgi:3-oxoacyl-(acyl-carrier-protein) synthase/thioesterase domain-containing protein/acyl carrier protein